MSAADRVPVEVWAQIAEHLLRPLPAKRDSDWDELHQHDLATLMRVSKAIYTATGPVLYRCAVVKDICAFTYGLNRPDADEDEDQLADENDTERRGRTRGKRCSRRLRGLPPRVLRPTVVTPASMQKERLLSFVRHLHLVYINGGLLQVVTDAIDSLQHLDNNPRPAATRHESLSALIQLSEALASSLRALRVLRPLQLSKLSLGAYGKQEPNSQDRELETASPSIRTQIYLVHKAFRAFVRHSRPITICQHGRVFAFIFPELRVQHDAAANELLVLDSSDHLFVEHTSFRVASSFGYLNRTRAIGCRVRWHYEGADVLFQLLPLAAMGRFLGDLLLAAVASTHIAAVNVPAALPRTKMEFVLNIIGSEEPGVRRTPPESVDPQAGQALLDSAMLYAKQQARDIVGETFVRGIRWKDRFTVRALESDSPWGPCGCPVD